MRSQSLTGSTSPTVGKWQHNHRLRKNLTKLSIGYIIDCERGGTYGPKPPGTAGWADHRGIPATHRWNDRRTASLRRIHSDIDTHGDAHPHFDSHSHSRAATAATPADRGSNPHTCAASPRRGWCGSLSLALPGPGRCRPYGRVAGKAKTHVIRIPYFRAPYLVGERRQACTAPGFPCGCFYPFS